MRRFEGNKAEIEDLYASGKSIRQIALLYKVNGETIRHYCHRVGIRLRARGEATKVGHQTGNINHWWSPPNKGYKYIRNDGYVCLSKVNHPNTDSTGRLYEHRKIMAEILGRPLTKDEIVHHLDGNPSNNEQDNLFLVTRHSHDRFSLRKALQRRIRQLQRQLKEQNQQSALSFS